MAVAAQDKPLRDAFGGFLDRFTRRHPHRAIRQNGFQPIDLVASGRRMAEKDLVVEHKLWRHRPQPVEMRGVELRVRGPVPRPHLLRRPVDQITVVIAKHMDGVERHQCIHRPPRIERSARHVAEIDDVGETVGADVGNNRFQREIVSVHIGNRGEAHCQPIPAACRWLRAHGRRGTAIP